MIKHEQCVCDVSDHDTILFDIWEFVASFAWESFALYGRGILRLDFNTPAEDRVEAEIEYHPKPHYQTCVELLETYDPEAQIVAVITSYDGDNTAITTRHLIEGWPPPRHADAALPANDRAMLAH